MINLSRQLTNGALAIATTSLALGSLAGAASAVSLGGGSFTNPLQVTEINQSGILPKSDPGWLTSATLKIKGSTIQAFTGKNTAMQAQTAKLTSTTDLFFTLPPELAAFTPIPLISISNDSGFQSFAVGQTKSFGPFSDMDMVSYTFTDAAALAFLTGPGSFSVSCESFSGFTLTGGGGNIATTQDTQAGCGAEISYEGMVHTTTPEPSAVLGLFALAGFGVLTRRRLS